MRKLFTYRILTCIFLLTPLLLNAQTNKNVGIGTTTPDPSAVLDITSTDKGVLIPRMSSVQRTAINTPASGLMVYDTDSLCFFYYNNFVWTSLCDPNTASNGVTKVKINGKNDYELGSPLNRYTDIPLAGNTLTFSATSTGGNVGIGNAHPHASAILDLNNDNGKGFLVPKMTLTSTAVAAPVSNPTVGLLVFNTNIVNDVFPGFYFWDGNVWVRLYSSNLPAVSKINVIAPVFNTGTATNPILGVTTGDLNGSSVVSVTNGSGRVTGGSSKVDVVGASGSVLYGTGTSSAFSVPGNTGELLQSNGSNPPSWVNPASLITSSDLLGSSVINVTNGANKVLGLGGASIDVTGPSGTVMYGTGTSANFTSQGAPGQFLQSNGTGAPTWASITNTTSDLQGSGVVSVSNGTGKVYGVGNAVLDVTGTAGGLLYGTGTSSAFTSAGAPGQFLQANGAGAPVWTSSSNVNGSSTVNVTNGSGQVVGGTNMDIDVIGAAGTVLYGTGTSSAFTPQGQPGYLLQSNGSNPPTWVLPSAIVASSDLNGSSVLQVTNGANRVVGLGGASLDVVGTTIGSVLYGTGASSAFTGAGTSGQYLKSNGAAAPTWSNGANVTGSTTVAITNGTGQVVNGPMSVDVVGTNGGIMYGTGTSSNFTAAGLAGQVMVSNGAGAPTWGNVSANSGLHVNTPNVQLGGTLLFDTDIPLNGKKMTFSGTTGNVGIGTNAPAVGAILDLTSTNKAFAPPRMTTIQRDAIPSPSSGMVIFNLDCDMLNYYSTGGYWKGVVSPGGAPTALAATLSTTTSFQANWTAVTGSSGYRLDVSTSNTFASFVPGYNNLFVAGTSSPVTGLTNCVTYYYRVRAVFCSGPSDNSNTVSAAPHTAGSQTFAATGATQTFTVPCGVYSLTVKMWGAGGSEGYYAAGGSGGYVEGVLAVTPSQVITLVVGKGGGGNSQAASIVGGFGGGGTAFNDNTCYGINGGGGGGRSSIQFTAGTDIVTAGGGAGGGSYSYNYYPNGGGAGKDGWHNLSPMDVVGPGSGRAGTAVAGGAAGVGAPSGTAGTQYQGGNGGGQVCNYPGGAGGGGYYGGGGGAGNSYGSTEGGGGGGSNYTGNPAFTVISALNGNTISSGTYYPNIAPPNTAAPYVAGVGEGARGYIYNYTWIPGGNGQISLSW